MLLLIECHILFFRMHLHETLLSGWEADTLRNLWSLFTGKNFRGQEKPIPHCVRLKRVANIRSVLGIYSCSILQDWKYICCVSGIVYLPISWNKPFNPLSFIYLFIYLFCKYFCNLECLIGISLFHFHIVYLNTANNYRSIYKKILKFPT